MTAKDGGNVNRLQEQSLPIKPATGAMNRAPTKIPGKPYPAPATSLPYPAQYAR